MVKRTTAALGKTVAAAAALTIAGTAAVAAVKVLRPVIGAGSSGGGAVRILAGLPGEAGLARYSAAAAGHLSELVAFRTVSSLDSSLDSPLGDASGDVAEFEGFIAALARLYPRVHGVLEAERVNGLGLLFRWRGTDPDPTQRPVVLMAHYDVVPVNPHDSWTHEAFSGHQEDGYVWGRGTLDDKGALVVVMEAVESLLAEGFAPAQDIHLSFGNDEETIGSTAAATAALLESRGVRPWLVLDEGGAVALEAFPGVKQPVAVVGVAEKGVLDLELLVRAPGGHASTPPKMGATARLARAIVRLENNPFPQSLNEPTVAMLQILGSQGNLGVQLALGAVQLAKPLVVKVFGRLGNETRAMTRTTVAITELEGSKGANVLASTARANANIRIMPGEDIEGTVARVRRIINDPKVELRIIEGDDPSPVSPWDNEQFAAIAQSVAVSYPQALVVPYVETGATDSRHFTGISPAVYRFSPLLMDAGDRASLHAVNERVRISSLGTGVQFYRELISRLSFSN